jgi:hypothetical protein
MYSVTFAQYLHASQKAESSATTYTTYTEVTDAVLRYFDERMGKYPNEVFDIPEWGLIHRTLHEISMLLNVIYVVQVEEGVVCPIHLTFDGPDGKTILQTVTIQAK